MTCFIRIMVACISLSLLILNGATAQKIKFKGETIYIEGQPQLKFKKQDINNISFYDLNGEELFFLKYIHKGKHTYNRVIFFKEQQAFESHSYVYDRRLLIKQLCNNGVLTNGKIDAEKLEKFIIKYDESYDFNYSVRP